MAYQYNLLIWDHPTFATQCDGCWVDGFRYSNYLYRSPESNTQYVKALCDRCLKRENVVYETYFEVKAGNTKHIFHDYKLLTMFARTNSYPVEDMPRLVKM